MGVNLGVWLEALRRPVKFNEKERWDGLDPISKWLIATRGTVTQLTLYAGIIAGLLAWRDGHFAWLPWLVMTLGIYFAHSSENLLNDYIDFTRGIDEDNYYRSQYGIHPLVHGFWSKREWLRWFLAAAALATLAGLFILIYTAFSPVVIGLFAIGAVLILTYAYPLKYLGLGELSIFLIWGLLLIPGIYAILAGGVTPDFGNVVLTSLAFGLGFGSFNWGKHIDKLRADAAKGVRSLPVRLGEPAARVVNICTLSAAYLVILYLIFVPHFFTPILLIVFFAAGRAWRVIKLLSQPRPTEAPPGFALWPRWFSTPQLLHQRLFAGMLMLGIVLDILIRSALPGFWQ